MRNSVMNIRLVASERMDKGGESENGYIRIPKRARLYFNSRGSRLRLQADQKIGVLKIKTAFKEDVTELAKNLKQGTVTEEQVRITGFVTSVTLRHYLGRRKRNVEDHCYVTDNATDIKIGADPEFCLVDPKTKKFQYAQHVPGLDLNGVLGHDGPLAEVRPAPSVEVSEVVDNISKALKENHSKIDQFSWLGGATYKSPPELEKRVVQMGGHIHIGNPALLENDKKAGAYTRIVRVLDEVVALPLVKIDTPEPHLRRNKEFNGFGNYGRALDHKSQEGRFEWRVPSGLWLIHPDIAMATLGTTKAVSEACYQTMAEKNFDQKWINAPEGSTGFLKSWDMLDAKKVAEIINNATPESVSSTLIYRAGKKLKNLPNYHKHKAEIDEFIRLVKLSAKDRKNISLDLKKNWLRKGLLIKKRK